MFYFQSECVFPFCSRDFFNSVSSLFLGFQSKAKRTHRVVAAGGGRLPAPGRPGASTPGSPFWTDWSGDRSSPASFSRESLGCLWQGGPLGLGAPTSRVRPAGLQTTRGEASGGPRPGRGWWAGCRRGRGCVLFLSGVKSQ